MSWIDEHRDGWRMAALILLVVAAMGPWTYTSDGMPPPESCRDPNVLLGTLDNGRCVRLVSAVEIFRFWIGAFISLNAQLVDGTLVFPDRAREFFGVFVIFFLLLLLVQPFFSTLALMFGDGRLRRRYQVAAWGLAFGLSGLLLVGSFGSGLHARLWGMWLYVALAASVLAAELWAVGQARR